ncbi:MAG: hypothetical protein EOO38_12735 [Cytophagaceae bacterium]|nr:MAG: hypothetical protein EOO38_12735 [Cytophagaceae bacterium]
MTILAKPTSNRFIGMSCEEVIYAANHRRYMPKTRSDINVCAIEATQLCLNADIAAHAFWTDIAAACRKLSIALADILFSLRYCNKTLAEVILLSGDWPTCQLVWGNLPDGIYAGGEVIKNGNMLTTKPDADGHCQGIITYEQGGWYGGAIKEGKRHGVGLHDTAYQIYYFGGWKEDKRHGAGCSESLSPRYLKREGRWDEGVLVEAKERRRI